MKTEWLLICDELIHKFFQNSNLIPIIVFGGYVSRYSRLFSNEKLIHPLGINNDQIRRIIRYALHD